MLFQEQPNKMTSVCSEFQQRMITNEYIKENIMKIIIN